MSRPATYKKVLGLYKQLYRTREVIFQDDTKALNYTLNRLRGDFRKNKEETDKAKIKELIKQGREVDNLLRTGVIQTTKVSDKDNVHRLRVKDYMVSENHVSNNN